MDVSKMKAFSYSGYDCCHPQDLLNEVVTGLAAVRQAILGFDLDATPSSQAVTGIGNILEGLIATLESVDPLFEDQLNKRYQAGIAEGARLRDQVPAEAIRELVERYGRQHVAAE